MIRKYRAYKKGPLYGLESVRTHDIEGKIWDYLKRYQSKDFVKKKLKDEFIVNTTIIDDKADQISALIVQSEKYYSIAKTAGPEIKPLLLYYGMVGLSKALILSGDNPYTLDSIYPNTEHHSTHGLSVHTNDLKDKLIRDKNKILNEFCYVKSTSNRPGLYNLLRSCYSNTPLPSDTRVTVKDLLSRIPELYIEYQKYFSENPNSWGCEAGMIVQSQEKIKHSLEFEDWYYLTQRRNGSQSYKKTIAWRFKETKTLYVQNGASEDKYLSSVPIFSIDDYIYVSELLTLQQFAIKRLNNFSISDIDIHFLLMFILSNLVRYRQDKWANLIRRTYNDEAFLIESFVDLSTAKFPLLILKELDNSNYSFLGQMSSWG